VESNQPTEEIGEATPLTTEEIVARLTSPSRKVRLDLLARLSSPGAFLVQSIHANIITIMLYLFLSP
jgi:hypothetical protein